MDLGLCCDLLSGYPKQVGMQSAIRYLSPQVLLCDELYRPQEVEAVEAAANSGVAVVTSIHAGSPTAARTQAANTAAARMFRRRCRLCSRVTEHTPLPLSAPALPRDTPRRRRRTAGGR